MPVTKFTHVPSVPVRMIYPRTKCARTNFVQTAQKKVIPFCLASLPPSPFLLGGKEEEEVRPTGLSRHTSVRIVCSDHPYFGSAS